MSAASSFWYTLLVRLFPSDFRAEFGREVTTLILEQRANLSSERLSHRLRFHVMATFDLLRAAGIQWRPSLLRLMSIILFIAATANLGYDLANPKLSMGVFAWAMTFAAIISSLFMADAAVRRRRTG